MFLIKKIGLGANWETGELQDTTPIFIRFWSNNTAKSLLELGQKNPQG